MNIKISKKINQINKKFYKTIFESFNQTRRNSWDAWKNILDKTDFNEKINVLDLGCGNGRFAEFLNENLGDDIEINYTGIDSSEELLNLGKKQLKEIKNKNLKFKFLEKNILKDKYNLKGEKFDLIVLFGVMHHMYDEDMRINLFKKVKGLLKKNGKFVFTTWQFLNNERQKKKILDLNSEKGEIFLKEFELVIEDFKENDYILSWERKVLSYRYCHHYKEEEIKNILEKSNFKLKETFFGDGKEGNLNQYFVVE